jgi:hypothetical protein
LEAEEFQFVAPNITIGEETTEDYFPGTVLIGARTGPDEPWILSRNSRAEPIFGEDSEVPDQVGFVYEFGLLDEIRVEGTFYETGGAIPHVCWDLQLRNRSRRSIEIGELGFPMAFNSIYEGFPKVDRGIRDLYQDRVYVHKFIGGAASYLFAQRLTARPPGLLVVPGDATEWEFYHHVRASLNSPYRWEGIPVVYVHSRATIEREEWGEWFNGHTSVVLEPGEERNYQLRFVPADRDRMDYVGSALAAIGRPAFRLYPAAVAPAEVGIAVEMAGAVPARFEVDVAAEMETDADQDGGFCFVRPKNPGLTTLTVSDTEGRISTLHLLFTEPIESLIRNRARWIVQNQVVTEKGPLFGAILPGDNGSGTPLTDPEFLAHPFGIESSLADAMFLAEKNALYPEPAQIGVLDTFLSGFLEQRIINPADASVGCMLPDLRGVAMNYGRAQAYIPAALLYASMARVAETGAKTRRTAADYALMAGRIAESLFIHVRDEAFLWSGMPLMAFLEELPALLTAYGETEHAERLEERLSARRTALLSREYPFDGQSAWSLEGYAEIQRLTQSDRVGRGGYRLGELGERAMRYAFAARSVSPCWWWYGSDKRWLEDADVPHPVLLDKGEQCFGPTSVAHAAMMLHRLGYDTQEVPESYLRAACGGLFGIWSLVRNDGAAGMGFCPDSASAMYGIAPSTGDIGLGLYQYLREATALVVPLRPGGVQTVGCHLQVDTVNHEDVYTVRPWDGVGRRISVRRLGLDVALDFGHIDELRFDAAKRRVQLEIRNPAGWEVTCRTRVRGMWGTGISANGFRYENGPDGLKLAVTLTPESSNTVELEAQ